MNRKIFWLLLLFPFFGHLAAQPATQVYEELWGEYKQGIDFFEKGLYAQAERKFEQVVNKNVLVQEPKYQNLLTQSELYIARCAVRSNNPKGKRLMEDFVRKYSPEPIAGDAVIEMGDYYYNAGKFETAATYYKMVDMSVLNKNQRHEVKFKLGYGEFVQKRFAQAKGYFREVKDGESKFAVPANYYYGMCCYFDNQFEEAIRSFEKCKNSKQYGSSVPYYITQIYFAQKKYDQVISYAEPKLNDGNLRNTNEMKQLVGQSYFEKEDFKKALPYLEGYAESTGSLRADEIYQLGYCQYKNQQYAKAAKNFDQLGGQNNKIGQSAMYLLGDCLIRANNKPQARSAFANASRMDFDKKVQDDALFNYGKLSAELKYDREAVNALNKIPSSSPNYREAQNILSELFLNTRDYDKALEVLEGIPDKSTKMNETVQKVALYRGLQLYQNNKADEAQTMFKKSLLYPVDATAKAEANFWLADIAHKRKEFDGSIKYLNAYFPLAKNSTEISEEASLPSGNYLQGYNYLKLQNYNTAKGYFQDAVANLKKNSSNYSSSYLKNNILGDAILRAGDCNFKQNKYEEALKFYDEAVSKRYKGYEYALFQKAMIMGLKGQYEDKLLALEKITKDFPNSEFADDALLEQGSSLLELNRLKEATVPLKKLVDNYKGKSSLVNQGLLKLGLVTYNQGNLQQAINYYKQVFANNPDSDEAKQALSALEEIYVKDLGKPDEYFAFVETVPGYKVSNMTKDSVSFKAAEAQFENGNYEKAINGYTDYLSKFPNGSNSLLAYYRRAECNVALKQYKPALKDYEAVIAKGNSKHLTKALEKAALISYNIEQNFGKAYDYYSQLSKSDVDENTKFEAQLGAMRAAYRSNNIKGTVEMAEKVAKSPNATPEQVATASFYIGKAAMNDKDYEKALSAFNSVIKNSKTEQSAEARYNIAYIYYLQRDLDTALSLCEKTATESAEFEYWVAKSIILQSDIYSEQGDIVNAKAALEAVIENFNQDKELVAEAQKKLEQLNGKSKPKSKLSPTKPGNNSLLEMDGNN